MAGPEGKGCEIGERIAQRHQSVRGDRSRKGGGIAAMFLPSTENYSPVPIPCNLNHPTKHGRKPSAGREAPNSAKGRRVDAAQVPAHAHRVPALASSPGAKTLQECKTTSRRNANQDGRPRRFPEKLPKKADFLWTGFPYGP